MTSMHWRGRLPEEKAEQELRTGWRVEGESRLQISGSRVVMTPTLSLNPPELQGGGRGADGVGGLLQGFGGLLLPLGLDHLHIEEDIT